MLERLHFSVQISDVHFASSTVSCRVNCKEGSSVDNANEPSTKMTTTEDPSIKECRCGHSLALERIVNGEDVINPGTYPWQVILIANGRFTCGGTLISPEFIVTAAHCVYKNDASDLQVILGRHNYTQANTEPTEQIRKVARTFIHPDFDINVLNHDLALLKLESKVIIDDHVSAACLPQDPDEDFGKGTIGIATGWGSLRATSKERPQILQFIKVPTWDPFECGKFPTAQITENMICAGGDDKDACQGDSGGPLVTEVGDEFVLIGVTSWGMGCATVFVFSSLFYVLSI